MHSSIKFTRFYSHWQIMKFTLDELIYFLTVPRALFQEAGLMHLVHFPCRIQFIYMKRSIWFACMGEQTQQERVTTFIYFTQSWLRATGSTIKNIGIEMLTSKVRAIINLSMNHGVFSSTLGRSGWTLMSVSSDFSKSISRGRGEVFRLTGTTTQFSNSSPLKF